MWKNVAENSQKAWCWPFLLHLSPLLAELQPKGHWALVYIWVVYLLVLREGRASPRPPDPPQALWANICIFWPLCGKKWERACVCTQLQCLGRMGRSHAELLVSRCREEDAGIYQASARNNKGIVSCSGVLEVGTMTEFKIHQKWFAKIKRKAEEKLREIEQSKKRGKENVEVENVQGMSPDRLQRKRRLARDLNLRSGASPWEKEDAAKVHVGDSQSRFHEAELKEQSVNTMAGLPNKLVAPLKAEVTTNGDACLESAEENGNGFLAYIYETVEDLVAKPMAKDSAAKKKKKVEDAPAPKQEVSKREESGRDRTKPSTNPRFAPPVPLRRSAHLRVANDQEAENTPKIKESGKAVNQDTKINGDVHFSLKEMYFDNQVNAAAEKEEAGAKEEAAREAALQPAGVSRQTEGASPSSEVSKAGPAPPEGRKSQHTAQKSEGHKAVGPEVTRTDLSQRGCGAASALGGCLHPKGAAAAASQVSSSKNTQETVWALCAQVAELPAEHPISE